MTFPAVSNVLLLLLVLTHKFLVAWSGVYDQRSANDSNYRLHYHDVYKHFFLDQLRRHLLEELRFEAFPSEEVLRRVPKHLERVLGERGLARQDARAGRNVSAMFAQVRRRLPGDAAAEASARTSVLAEAMHMRKLIPATPRKPPLGSFLTPPLHVLFLAHKLHPGYKHTQVSRKQYIKLVDLYFCSNETGF